MLNVHIKTLPHRFQRYDTLGDWQDESEGFAGVTINVSNMNNLDFEFAVAVHELVEWYLCKKARISGATVTAFDVKCLENELYNPGESTVCPYHSQHAMATKIETEIVKLLGYDPVKYFGDTDAENITT